MKGEIDLSKLAPNYWTYNLCILVCTLLSTVNNFNFLRMALINATRRRLVLNELTNALELDFEMKDAISVRYPTINFCDAMSLATWMEARRLAFSIGKRFTKRIHYFVLCFLIVAIVYSVIFLMFAADYVPDGIFDI